MICPYCDKEIRNDSRFCSHCGKKIIYCPTCNNALREDIRFCPNDGTPINNSPAESAPEFVAEDLQSPKATYETNEMPMGQDDRLQTNSASYETDQNPMEQDDRLQTNSASYETDQNPARQNDSMYETNTPTESAQEAKGQNQYSGNTTGQNQYSRNTNGNTKNRKKAVFIIVPAVLIAAAIIGGSMYYKRVTAGAKNTPEKNSSDSKSKSATATEKAKVTSALEPTATPKAQNPELEAYSALLSNGADNGEMAVFDLNKDGIYEVALRDASVSDELPDGVGMLSYSSDTGMIITPLDSIEYVGYINESAGQLMTDRIRGKVIYSFKELMSDGYFMDLESYCLPYLQEQSNGATVDDIVNYNEMAEGMEEPNWVSITEDNIQEYLSGKGKSTGTSGARPEELEVPEEEPVEADGGYQAANVEDSGVYSYINGDWEINGGGASNNWSLYKTIDNGVLRTTDRDTGEVTETPIDYAVFNDDKTKIVIVWHGDYGYGRYMFDVSGGRATVGDYFSYQSSNGDINSELFSEDSSIWMYSGGSSITRN